MAKKTEWTLEKLIKRRNYAHFIERDALELLKDEALIAWNPDAYVIACDALGVDFERPELAERSFLKQQIPQTETNAIHSETNQRSQNKPAIEAILGELRGNRIPSNFKISNSGYFKKIATVPVKQIWYGMNNLKIPTIMLAAMDSLGILSKYWAAGAKRTRPANEPTDFYSLCDEINRCAYPNLNKPGKRGGFSAPYLKNRYFKKREDEMLKLVPQKEQEKFLESYFKPHVPSKSEDSFNGADYDHFEGHAKNFYATNAMSRIKKDYQDVLSFLRQHNVRMR